MSLDVGPFFEAVAPLSVLVACAFGIARVIYKQEDQGKAFREYKAETILQFSRLHTKFDDLMDKHRGLENRVTQEEMYERGLADATQRHRVTGRPSRKPRVKR